MLLGLARFEGSGEKIPGYLAIGRIEESRTEFLRQGHFAGGPSAEPVIVFGPRYRSGPVIPLPASEIGKLLGLREQRLTFLKLRFGVPALGDVLGASDDANGLARFRKKRNEPGSENAEGPILHGGAILVFLGLPGRNGFGQQNSGMRAVVWMDHFQAALSAGGKFAGLKSMQPVEIVGPHHRAGFKIQFPASAA